MVSTDVIVAIVFGLASLFIAVVGIHVSRHKSSQNRETDTEQATQLELKHINSSYITTGYRDLYPGQTLSENKEVQSSRQFSDYPHPSFHHHQLPQAVDVILVSSSPTGGVLRRVTNPLPIASGICLATIQLDGSPERDTDAVASTVFSHQLFNSTSLPELRNYAIEESTPRRVLQVLPRSPLSRENWPHLHGSYPRSDGDGGGDDVGREPRRCRCGEMHS